MERKVVIPGEEIIAGDDYLPGDGTEKREGKIYSLKFGLAEEQNNLIKGEGILPLLFFNSYIHSQFMGRPYE